MFSVMSACKSFCSQGHRPFSFYRALALVHPVQRPVVDQNVQTCSIWTSLYRATHPYLDMLKLVHYVAHAVGKRAVGIRLKCLFVFYFHHFCASFVPISAIPALPPQLPPLTTTRLVIRQKETDKTYYFSFSSKFH